MPRRVGIGTPFRWLQSGVRTLYENPASLLLWAILIFALIIAGFATRFLGLVVVVPILGHASWHAYRDLIEDDRSA